MGMEVVSPGVDVGNIERLRGRDVSSFTTQEIDKIFSDPVGIVRRLPGRRTFFPAGQSKCPIPSLRLSTKTSANYERVTGFATNEQYTITSWMFARLAKTLAGDEDVYQFAKGTPTQERAAQSAEPLPLAERIKRHLDAQSEGKKNLAEAVKSGILEAYSVFIQLNGNLSTAMKSVFNYLASNGTGSAYYFSRVGKQEEWPVTRLPEDRYIMTHNNEGKPITGQANPEQTEQVTEEDCLGRSVANEILSQIAIVINSLPPKLKKQYFVPDASIRRNWMVHRDMVAFRKDVKTFVASEAERVHSYMTDGFMPLTQLAA